MMKVNSLEFDQVSFLENLISYDASEFLREFNHLQSSNVDILARALELSSIPSNNDLLRGEVKLLLSRKSRRKIGQFPKVCSYGSVE